MTKSILSLLIFFMISTITPAQQTSINSILPYPVYAGTDLGCTYSKSKTSIRVYAPTADAMQIHLYREGMGDNLIKTVPFTKSNGGAWLVELPGDNHGIFYTVQTRIDGMWRNEVTDPYAKAVGVNGDRVQILDLATTNPPGWNNDKTPAYTKDHSMQDAIIYELQIRDASMHSSSGIEHKGKFLGLTEIPSSNHYGQSTGLQHMKELGVTHVHLLPFFDFNSIDETRLATPQYNWGYDPKNYNVPEGSFSTNPYDPSVRIRECKMMIHALHKAGLNVVMDVVYNHTALSATSNFNQLVPGYYHRMKSDGSFADASACGNEIASEQPMMRKFMIESLLYWVNEYHIDGFRFDLMGIFDIETMNEIAASLRKIKPDILLYGEGWAAGNPMIPKEDQALKQNVSKLDRIAVFSDNIRDGMKGYVFEDSATGFVNGNPTLTETVKFGIAGAMPHAQVDMQKAMYNKVPYATAPGQVINYADCHDNLVLWDKINITAIKASHDEKVKMQQMAFGLVLTSQGIPFLHAGSEFLRTKMGVENSYNKPDNINAIDWDGKFINKDMYEFVKSLVNMRKTHSLFRLRSYDAVAHQLQFLNLPQGMIGYTIDRRDEKDSWKKVLVVCNALNSSQTLRLPAGNWNIAISTSKQVIPVKDQMQSDALSFTILYQ